MFFTNWKTTSAGLLSIVGGIVRLAFAISAGSITEEAVMTTVAAIITGAGFLFSRDYDVSSKKMEEKAAEKGIESPIP